MKREILYRDDGTGNITVQEFDTSYSGGRFSLAQFFRAAFLPEGYPNSVSDDYLAYQTWDTVQAFASSISGSLSTQAVLKGVGVGDDTATALSATMTWLTRQGAGMIAQIIFTWTQGTDLDHNCKKWRLFADVMNDFASGLELTGPMWPSAFLQPILCFASVARALVGVAGGATRTAITQHQARSNNISDVAAKDGSQETMVNLAALLVNLVILPLISEDPVIIWTLFLGLTALHLYANYKAVSTLVFETLNKDRFLTVVESYNATKQTRVPGPYLTNKNESVFLGLHRDESTLCGSKLLLGCSLSEALKATHKKPTMSSILSSFNRNGFSVLKSDGCKTYVLVSDDGPNVDYLKAYFVAFQMNYWGSTDVTKHLMDYEKFVGKLNEAGWNTTHFQIGFQGWTGDIPK